MDELIPSLILVGISIGATLVLGSLAWCWIKLTLRLHR